RGNCPEKSASSGRPHIAELWRIARGKSQFQRAVAAFVASRAGDDAVHGRIPPPDSGGGDGAGGLGTGGEKLRGNFSRRRRGKNVAAANRRTARQTLAGNQNENHIRFREGFSRPAARAG